MKTRAITALAAGLMLLTVLSGCMKKSAIKKDEGFVQPPLTIAYSDWPGWIAWDIGIQKGFFKDEGVSVEFQWFEYVPSMDAFAAGKVDAVTMTNGDALITGALGAPNVIILINDYSNGNDMIVANPGINTISELKGKKIGIEIGFVEHLLLLTALQKAGMSESDVLLVNTPTHQTAQTLASGDVDAIAAWQPNSGQALKAVAGSKAIFTSADEPGLIYDALCVSPESLASRREDWVKVARAWYKIVDYMNNPTNKTEMLEILSARVNIAPDEYEPFLAGTKILSLEESKAIFKKGEGFGSLYGSTSASDSFFTANGVYETAQDVDSYIDGSLIEGL